MLSERPSSFDTGVNFPPNEETFCRRKTFYVNADWQLGSELETAKSIVGQMYVECLEPLNQSQRHPIILIHGDFHTGQVWLTKPDGNPGWASFFASQGYTVYTLDLPPAGRSNFLTSNHLRHRDIAQQSQSLDASLMERELTASGQPQFHRPEETPAWARAKLHNKWPGTGMRGDPIFAKYCASLSTLTLTKVERQTVAQHALKDLLRITGKSIILGEGAGCTMAWLAADAMPDHVAAIVAVEPNGPPFGVSFYKQGNCRVHDAFIKPNTSMRKYGLADIPLTYDPPWRIVKGLCAETMANPSDIKLVYRADNRGSCIMQSTKDMGSLGPDFNHQNLQSEKREDNARQLVHLKKIPHAVITAQASSHTAYDWATVAFMRQAGLKTDWIRLEDLRIMGNGHLMFLETNSNQIAAELHSWIKSKVSKSGTYEVAATSLSTQPPVQERHWANKTVATKQGRSAQKDTLACPINNLGTSRNQARGIANKKNGNREAMYGQSCNEVSPRFAPNTTASLELSNSQEVVPLPSQTLVGFDPRPIVDLTAPDVPSGTPCRKRAFSDVAAEQIPPEFDNAPWRLAQKRQQIAEDGYETALNAIIQQPSQESYHETTPSKSSSVSQATATEADQFWDSTQFLNDTMFQSDASFNFPSPIQTPEWESGIKPSDVTSGPTVARPVSGHNNIDVAGSRNHLQLGSTSTMPKLPQLFQTTYDHGLRQIAQEKAPYEHEISQSEIQPTTNKLGAALNKGGDLETYQAITPPDSAFLFGAFPEQESGALTVSMDDLLVKRDNEWFSSTED